MALNTQLSDDAANAGCNAITAKVSGGSVKLYTGVQPANGNAPVTGTLLVTLPLNTPAYNAAVAGTAALNTTTPVQAVAVANGTAGYAVFCDSGGNVKWMGSVGTSGCNVNIGSVTVASGVTIEITSGNFSVNEAGS